MILDFIGFINSTSDLSDIQQTMMLDDFCDRYGFIEDLENDPELTKREFANQKITEFIQQTVDSQRRKQEEKVIKINSLVLTPLKSLRL